MSDKISLRQNSELQGSRCQKRMLPFLAVILSLLTSACGGVLSHFGPETKPFRYEPPARVSDADRDECESSSLYEARAAGRRITGAKGMNTAGLLLGPLFLLGVGKTVHEAEEQAYESTFRDCLKEKGYTP